MAFSYLTVPEAAKYTTLSTQYLTLLARKREVPHSRVGRRIVFRSDRLDEWLAKRESKMARASVFGAKG